MTYNEIVDYLYNLPRFTKGGHMDNVKRLLAALGHPEESFYYIHVAGTNGKGSVCAYIERCLRLCHKKTGLFTSPHLIRVNERMRICGEEISDEDFERIFHEVYALALQQQKNGCLTPTFFEYIYLMAMVYFREQHIDYGIIEAGLGGRTDFTNAAAHKRLTVITPVSLDHVPLLGTTVKEIAVEKAGIMLEDTPYVCGCQEPDALEAIQSRGNALGIFGACLNPEDIEIIFHDGKAIDFSMKSGYHGKCTFTIHTGAAYQAENAAVAVLAMEELWKDFGADCLDKAEDAATAFESCVARGLSMTRWPGRMEALGDRFYVDGAHNDAGVRAFADTICRGFGKYPLYLVFAVAGDKDYASMIRELAKIPSLKGVIITELENGRRCDREKVLAVFEKNWNGMICSTYNIKEAIQTGLLMRGDDGILCCVGSLYLVGSVKEITGGNSDDKL